MRTSHWAAALPMPKENEILIREMTSSFRRLVMEAGLDLWKMTHHCNRSGLERKRKDQIIYLKNVKSHCNYRLVLPERNLVTKEDCEQVEGFKVFKEPFYITDLLQRAKAVLSKNDLLLMVFLPLDFALPIEGTVKYPYHNCDFRPFVIRNRNESSPGHHFTFAQAEIWRIERAAERSQYAKSKGENHHSTVGTSCTRICSVLPGMHIQNRKRESSHGPFNKETAKQPRSSKRSLSGTSRC